MQRRTCGLVIMAWVMSLLATASLAQVSGQVEAIGYSGLYRPDCFVSMVVRLRPETSETGTYQIQVVQEDLDRDKVVYTRTVSLTGNNESQGVREQRYFMYFVPQATEDGSIHGLPDTADGKARLQERLKVFVCTAAGKQIAQLPLTSTIDKIDGFRSPWGEAKGTKLILVVSDPDSGSQAMSRDFRDAIGLQEDVVMVPVAPTDLPENVLGYDSIDAVLLLHVDPANLKLPTDERMRALKQYTSQGGRLVMCQLPEWEKMAGYGDLLPVTFPQYGNTEPYVQGNGTTMDPGLLRSWAKAEKDSSWDHVKGPFRIALAEPKTGSLVDDWWDWKGTEGMPAKSAYLVRAVYGLGSVTWVGQDLGETSLIARARTGWMNIWDRVFDWKEEPIVLTSLTSKEDKDAYASAAGIDMGKSLILGMEHAKKGATLVFVAVVFFIAYWVLAGPVAYIVLLKQDRARLSWFIFGASAVAATLVTALVVKIALSGAAEIRHMTVARTGPATPAVIDSRIGLYIPKDGPQKITLKGTAPDAVSYVIPYPIHPQFISGNDYPAYMEYQVPIRDASADDPPSISIPFRRTLKKIAAHWIGITEKGIEGSVELKPAEDGYLSGTITNATGSDLRNIYIAFKFPWVENQTQDWVLYVPKLGKGSTIDLGTEWKAAAILPPDYGSVEKEGKSVRGMIGLPGRELQWDGYWHSLLNSSAGVVDNQYSDLSRSFVILSLFERIPPLKVTSEHKSRAEMMRRGGRKIDMSHLLAAGAMVVIAEADQTPLPFSLDVQGTDVPGDGTTFYQGVISLKRDKAEAAATRPSE